MKSQRASKPRRYWGGFCDGHLHSWMEGNAADLRVQYAVYRTRREASRYYEDVRPIEIKEVHRGKR